MAYVVDELPPNRGGTGRVPKYPWHDWMNGDVWLIEPGDYGTTTARTFVAQIHQYANRHGFKVLTRVRTEGIYVQAVRS